MGVGDVPPIAGRSPSYLVRQLFDIQQGTRRGAGTDLMKTIVAKLDPDDMAAIAAYVASKFPPDPVDSEAAAQLAALAVGSRRYAVCGMRWVCCTRT